MLKKLIFSIVFLFVIFTNIKEINAIENILTPLKKPTLSEKELKKKVLINILKPLAKPKKIIEEVQKEKTANKTTVIGKIVNINLLIPNMSAKFLGPSFVNENPKPAFISNTAPKRFCNSITFILSK